MINADLGGSTPRGTIAHVAAAPQHPRGRCCGWWRSVAGSPFVEELFLSLPPPRLSLWTAYALVVYSALAPSAQAAGALDPYLPRSGTISGHMVSFSISPDDQAISRRFRQAVQDNMDAFKRAAAGTKPGTALPYDPIMGISEPEYDHLLHLRPKVNELAVVTIEVVKQSNGGIAFRPKDAASLSLADVTFPPDETVAQTPFGTLAVFNAVHQTDQSAPLGVWNGAEWAQVMPAGSDKPSAKIAFGKRAEDGKGILYYQVAPFGDQGERSLVVFYALD